MLLNRKDICYSLPRLDCRFIRLHNFRDLKGDVLNDQYAECTNHVKTYGMVSIDIVKDANPLQWEVSCINCKYFESINQLSLF